MLECELIQRRSWSGVADAQRDIFEFIEGWYNTRRRYTSMGYLSSVASPTQLDLRRNGIGEEGTRALSESAYLSGVEIKQ